MEPMTQVLERILVPSKPTETGEEQNELPSEAPTKELVWSFLDDSGLLFAITDGAIFMTVITLHLQHGVSCRSCLGGLTRVLAMYQ